MINKAQISDWSLSRKIVSHSPLHPTVVFKFLYGWEIMLCSSYTQECTLSAAQVSRPALGIFTFIVRISGNLEKMETRVNRKWIYSRKLLASDGYYLFQDESIHPKNEIGPLKVFFMVKGKNTTREDNSSRCLYSCCRANISNVLLFGL